MPSASEAEGDLIGVGCHRALWRRGVWRLESNPVEESPGPKHDLSRRVPSLPRREHAAPRVQLPDKRSENGGLTCLLRLCFECASWRRIRPPNPHEHAVVATATRD